MEKRMIFAGFGGQGVLLAGQLIAEAGMKKGKNVTWMPSYGPEMRGGSANCSVVVSDDMIGTPIILDPNILVAMNAPSLKIFESYVVSGGTIIYNSSLISEPPTRQDVTIIPLPCNEFSASLGQPRTVNMPLIGTIMELTKIFTLEDIKEVMNEKFSGKKAQLIELNLQAIEMGRKIITK